MLLRRLSLALLFGLAMCASAHAAVRIDIPLACETTDDTDTTLDLNGAASTYLGFEAAGMNDGDTTWYQLRNGSQRAEGYGTFNTGTPDTFTRDSNENSLDGLNTPLTLSGASTICIGSTSGVLTDGLAVLDVDSVTVTTEAYDATNWNADETVPTKDAVRDKIETLQPLDSDLTSWAAIARASGFDTFVATPSWTNFLSLVTSEPTLKSAGKQTIWVPSGAITPHGLVPCRKANRVFANNLNPTTCNFETSTDEYGEFHITFPKNWDEGNISFQPVWAAASGSGTVVFALTCAAISNDDPIGTATFGAEFTSSDTLIAADDLHVGPESTATAVGGTPAEGDMVSCGVFRDVSADTLGVDAELIGVKVFFNDSAANDD